MSAIVDIFGRQVLDSRGNPTVEVDVHLESGAMGRVIVPSGASTGSKEALELRDNRTSYKGKSVLKAVENVNMLIKEAILGLESLDQRQIDKAMIELDGTENKSKLGANAILGVSLALAKASSLERQMPLYRYLGGARSVILPVPLINVLNGGVHASSPVDIQEFMIVPSGYRTFSEALEAASGVFKTLSSILKEKGFSTAVGDEGGYAPALSSNEEAIELLLEAIVKSGSSHDKIKLAIDAAASEFYKEGDKKGYKFWKSSKKTLSSEEMVTYWENLIKKYPSIVSLEDPLDEEDWKGWKMLTDRVGDKIQLVGDDLLVTNEEYLSRAIKEKTSNAILVKLNQIGTLTETLDVVDMAKEHGFNAIISHRSGESEDSFIADLAVGVGSRQIKTGSLCRSDRTAKYNQLLRIEEELGDTAKYPQNLF